MIRSLAYGQLFIFCVVLKFQWTKSVKLLELSVPTLADPREELELGCRFDMDGEELYSVKWYKDEQEFFRYTPRQQPHIMSFPVAGVHLVPISTTGTGECGGDQCRVHLTRLSTAHSGGSYRCEVSTEAPAFRVAFEAANVTVAAVGRTDPQVTGVRAEYTPGDLVFADCSAAPADPAPAVTWLVNGQPVPPAALGPPRTSRPDSMGLVTRSVTLRFHVERRYFRPPHSTVELRCVVSAPPGVPAAPRSTTVTAASTLHRRDVLGNQKLAWPSSAAQVYRISCWLSTAICLLLRNCV